ncbi:putative expansin-b2 [Phtheirospermum japonicum]|uniref:Putative expansin-b2 n=1 Tax=Phtheirospermum japonicum TaxID=374723 RepID=A0A830BFT7_9LAMI|nr:putative expansin-b2 [Phtheirospermum japonicum]
MAYAIFTYLAFFSLISNFCHSLNPKLQNVLKADHSGSNWLTTNATWYGDANGAGTDVGVCGYGEAVESMPFNSRVTAVAPSLYNLSKPGYVCGTCYQVNCTNSAYCSGTPVTVIATDLCPGCTHLFDLSGTAFGAMAKSGQEEHLRDVGMLEVRYKSVACDYPGVSVAFQVVPTDTNFTTAIDYMDGHSLDGVALSAKLANTTWLPMQPSGDNVWTLTTLPEGDTAPFSIKLTDGSKIGVAHGVIPAGYSNGTTYRSIVKFDG